MTTPQQTTDATEANLNRTNLAVLQAVLTSTNAPLDIDWQKVMGKVDATRPDYAQRQFKNSLRKLGLAYPKVGGDITIADDASRVVPKKRGAAKKQGAASKKSKVAPGQQEEEKAEGEGNKNETG